MADAKVALPSILSAIPQEWRGTTFKNSMLLGREVFADKLDKLILEKGSAISNDDLVSLGNAEDYLRVATNICCVLEYYLGQEHGYSIDRVFTFASAHMPIIAVVLTSATPIHLYLTESESSPFSIEEVDMLSKISGKLNIYHGFPVAHCDGVVLVSQSFPEAFSLDFVDGIIGPSVLFIKNISKIHSSKILVIRKRMSTPLTTPAAEAWLRELAGLTDSPPPVPSEHEVSEFYSHLQVLSGTPICPKDSPVCFTAGLPAIASLYLSLVQQGGADIVMASTAYGGSSELTDIFKARTSYLNKHTFDITGKNDIHLAVLSVLDTLAQSPPDHLLPTTVLFVEIPTNPDMKVPDITDMASMLTAYQSRVNKNVLLFVDTTFAPGSRVLDKIHSLCPDLPAIAFISMSKSVSRGITTAGAIVGGQAPQARSLVEGVRRSAQMFDTTARPDQILRLVQNHVGVEERCQRAYEVAVAVGENLCAAVRTHCSGYDMPLAFVSAEHAAQGFSSSTFSFNLPPIAAKEGDEDHIDALNASLAQRFVDLLCAHEQFKPCVSFGQDNGLIYATVPATSTQGAIKAEDKAKQAVGGVQLTRLSFPPICDVNLICQIVSEAVATCYIDI